MSLTTGLQLPFGIQPVNPVPVDAWSGPFYAATDDEGVDAANAAIPAAIRYQSLEVRIIVGGISKKFWYRDGILDEHLIEVKGFSTTSGNVTELVLNESPSGSIDGINKDFELSSTPVQANDVMVWLNGQLMTRGVGKDFTINGRVISFNSFAPQLDDVILTMYTRSIAIKQYALNEPVAFTNNGGSLGLKILKDPVPQTSLMLFRNGQLLTQNSDYTLSDRNITVLYNAIESDDVFLATYSYTS